jgi:hypothetical protein
VRIFGGGSLNRLNTRQTCATIISRYEGDGGASASMRRSSSRFFKFLLKELLLAQCLILIPYALQGRISWNIAVNGKNGHIIFPAQRTPEGPQFPFLWTFFPNADPRMNTSRPRRLHEGYSLSHQVGLNIVPACLYIEFFDLSRRLNKLDNKVQEEYTRGVKNVCS